MENKHIEAIEKFIEAWKIKAVKYYIELKAEYIQERKKEYEVTADNMKCIIDSYYCKRRYSDEYIEKFINSNDFKNKTSLYSNMRYSIQYCKFQDWQRLYPKSTIMIIERAEADIKKIVDREGENKKASLILRIEKKAGIITDASNLTIGSDGNINGIIIGRKATVKVATIYAGGYNIQCLHYRVLVNIQ